MSPFAPLGTAVPRPGTNPPPNSTVEAIALAARELSPRMQRRVLGLVDDIVDAEQRGETITTVHIGLAPAESSTATRRPPSEPDDDPPPPPWDGVKGGKPGETP